MGNKYLDQHLDHSSCCCKPEGEEMYQQTRRIQELTTQLAEAQQIIEQQDQELKETRRLLVFWRTEAEFAKPYVQAWNNRNTHSYNEQTASHHNTANPWHELGEN